MADCGGESKFGGVTDNEVEFLLSVLFGFIVRAGTSKSDSRVSN